MRNCRIGSVVVVLVAALVSSEAAQGATAEVVCLGSRGCDGDAVTYRAAPGETNSLSVTRVSLSALRLVDLRAAVTADRGCEAVTEHEVVCTSEFPLTPPDAPMVLASVDLGDGDDQFVSDVRVGLLRAGPGRDVVHATGGIDGGPGQDTLVGGPGDDRFYLSSDGARPEADSIDGRGGQNTADYGDRNRPVTIDLGRGVGGEAGERDHLRSIAVVWGGRGDDRLRAGSRATSLNGGAGNDVLIGGPRVDVLDGGAGADRLQGEGGDDWLLPGEGREDRGLPGDRVACGRGRDKVDVAASRNTYVASDCERAGLTGIGWVVLHIPMPSPFRSIVGHRFECIDQPPCNASISIRLAQPGSRQQLLGRVSAAFRGASRRLALRLSPEGRAVLTGRKHIPVEFVFSSHDAQGRTEFFLSFHTTLAV